MLQMKSNLACLQNSRFLMKIAKLASIAAAQSASAAELVNVFPRPP